MRLALIFSTMLGIALLIGAVSYNTPMGAGAVFSADDIGDSADDGGEWPGPQDPQCGDQIGDDEDPGDTAPEDTPPSQPGFGSVGLGTPAPSATWDGDHDIEEDDCMSTTAPTVAPDTATPTVTPYIDLIDDDPVAEGADADCDGGVDGSDAVALLRSLSGAGGDVCDGGGDADCNGDVNSADVARILRIMAGLNEAC